MPHAAWDMAISRLEFERSLPEAVAGAAYSVEGERFHHRDGDRRGWDLRLTPLPERRIGLLALPRHRLEFRFEGYTAGEIDAFMVRFARYFQRGGG